MNRLKEAKEKYKEGTYFYSATEILKEPQKVSGTIRWSTIPNRNAIICDAMGILYDGDTDTWAKNY